LTVHVQGERKIKKKTII